MIITALTRHQPSSGSMPSGYARKPLGFQLTVLHGGSGCRLASLYVASEKTKKLVAPARLIPDMKRSGPVQRAFLGCDRAAYVLNRADARGLDVLDASEVGMVHRKHEAFRALLLEYADSSGDRIVDDYVRWVAAGTPGLDDAMARLDRFTSKRLETDPIALHFDGEPELLIDKPSARAFWSQRVVTTKSSGTSGLCLSCGTTGPLVDTLPQPLVGNRIPPTATQSNVALVSANFDSAKRSNTGRGVRSAPICAPCAGAAVASFNDLTSDPRHHFKFGDTAAAIWWTTEQTLDDDIFALDDNKLDPQRVRDFLDAPVSGRPASREFGKFYFFSFSGNVARLVVRRWIELRLDGVRDNLARWFADIETMDPEHPYPPLGALAKSLGPAPVGDRREIAPHGAFEALLLSALTGSAPPRELLHLATQRAIAEASLLRDDDNLRRWRAQQRAFARLATIRLVINRTSKEMHVTAHLDETNDDRSYLSGRLFAVRESLQREASGGVNASIVDRYFGRAMTHPASVHGALTRLEQQHLRALRRKGKDAAAAALDRKVGDLQARIDPAPGRQSAQGQAMWVAGYYQQREADIQARIAKSEENKLKRAADGADADDHSDQEN